ncbi:hypothetical protein FB45DRAFT_1066435 [Roridomyces roridus]|uniref:F-box domain-containing protein n=1 Tax=Roridomyces roridus TaxID=1738132 RepID=A0AAD7B3R8_9AGAR|nr:hypothetical protein FB45DRAFT_1066435 [Roridomyces roridus]
MHRCLQIPEVVRLICEQCTPKTLAVVGRTCRAWSEPALDVLWQAQTSLLPLIRCLPSRILSEESVGKSREMLHLKSAITPADWSRVQKYNRRVMSLTLESAELDADFFRAIEVSLPDAFLLPNLQSLVWLIEDDGFFPYSRLFLPPKLSRIHLVLQECPRDLSLLSTLGRLLPRLTNINIDVPVSAASIGVISDVVRAWNLIKQLSVVSLDAMALAHVASLPHLQDLRMQRYIPPPTAIVLPSGSFPALRHLAIVTDTLQSAFSLVSRISSTQLHSVSISTLRASPSVVWERALEVLPRLPFSRSLKSLSVEESCPTAPSAIDCPSKYILTSQGILPLLRLASISTLRISPFFGAQLDDAALHQLAVALPLLESIDLSPGTAASPSSPPRATPRALLFLAEHCPFLREVQLPLTASPSNIPSFERPRRSLPPHSLAYLDVGASPLLASPASLAVFLSSVFGEIGAFGAFGADSEGRWREVGRLFKLLRDVRREEARCWGGDWDEDDDDESSDEEGVSFEDDER